MCLLFGIFPSIAVFDLDYHSGRSVLAFSFQKSKKGKGFEMKMWMDTHLY